MLSYLILVNILEQTNKFFSHYTTVNQRLFIYFGDFITKASIYI